MFKGSFHTIGATLSMIHNFGIGGSYAIGRHTALNIEINHSVGGQGALICEPRKPSLSFDTATIAEKG
jgi:hypothetical protein